MKLFPQDLKSGDIILTHNYFTVKDKNTWLSPLVRFFTNLWEKVKSPFNHAQYVVELNGQLYLLDAKDDGFQNRGLVSEYYSQKQKYYICVLRPKFLFDERAYMEAVLRYKGVKYDYKTTMATQPIYQLTNERLWWGKDKDDKERVNCTEVLGYIWNDTLGMQLFENPERLESQYLYTRTDLFERYIFKKNV
jgi:hypothetical protein